MKNYFLWPKPLAVSLLLAGACGSDVDLIQRGVFIISNASGYDATLRVYDTRFRQRAPLLLAIPKGGNIERSASGGAGVIVEPELYAQGDSVRIVFSDGKQLLHYCPRSQPLGGQCTSGHSVLSLQEYRREQVSKTTFRYTFELTPADYATAR